MIEVAPRHKAAAAALDKPVYTGERLTLNFQDIETRAVLQLLADASGQNIVVSDSVNGSVTLRLQNVPWDQALDIVLRTKGLDKRRQDNVIIVAPQAELAAREKAELAARKDVQELEPLRSEYLQVNYAKAAELANLVKTNTNSLLSPRGSVSVDERTNTLLLMDTPDRLADIRRLVATLDIPVRQVQIEARIVIVNDDFQRQLGARFGFTNVQQNGNTGLVTTTGTAAGTDQIISSAINNVQTGTPPSIYPISVPTGATAPAPLQRQPAGVLAGRHVRPGHPRQQLHRRPGAVGGPGGDGGEHHLQPARHHRQPEGGLDRAGRGNSLPAVGLERRHHDPVQEGGAGSEGHPADHPGQPHHP